MRIKALGLLVFLLLLFSNVIRAQTVGPLVPYFCQPGNNIGNIYSTGADVGIALIALTISFDVVAIAFALSRLFPNMGIRNWLQNEYWELGKTVLIIVTIYALIVIIGNLSYDIVPLTGGTGLVPSPVTSIGSVINLAPLVTGAEGYLCGVNSNLTNTWEAIGIMSGGTGFWSSLQLGFFIPIPTPWVVIYNGVYFLPFSNWLLQTGNFMIAWYGSIINDFVNFILFPFSAIVIGLLTTLPALAYVGLTFFIPLGLAFRALPFIRGVGGTLIAVGVALCLVLPSTFILFNYIVTSMISSAIPITISSACPSFISPSFLSTCPGHSNFASTDSATCTSLYKSLPSWVDTLLCSPLIAVINTIAVGTNFLSSIWQGAVVFQTNAIFTYMNRIMISGLYMIIQMLLFAIDLVIMYPLVDNIARVMGGSIRLSLGGKLRLA